MFPRDFIEGFIKDYSEEDKIRIKKDLKIVEQITFDTAKPTIDESTTLEYLATAGGPGSAKTTALEAFLVTNKIDHFVYADPDQVSLKNMNFTYRQALRNYDFALAKSNYEALKFAYDKWRGASNYICHEMLQAAFDGKYSIAHGTTSTSPYVSSLYEKVKALGYRITLLLCYSQDETRKRAVERREREQAFVQTDPREVISKGSDFPRRFDIYFEYANEIFFYWNNELDHGQLPTPCARFVKNENDSSLTVINQTDWNHFCNKYLEDCKQYDIKICDRFLPFIPKKLLDTPKDSTTIAANALPRMGLYGTTSGNPSPKQVLASATSVNEFSESKTLSI